MAKGGRPSIVSILALVVLVAAAGGSALIVYGPESITSRITGESSTTTSTEPPIVAGGIEEAEQLVAAFANGIETNQFGGLDFGPTSMATVASTFDAVTAGLAPFTLTAAPGPVTILDDGSAEAPLDLTWTFPGDRVWTTATSVKLQTANAQWSLQWTPSVLEPSLAAGDELRRTRIAPGRAEILGRDGSVIVGQVNLVDVGVRPSRIEDLAVLATQLQDLVGADPTDLTARVQAADPSAFVDVATLARADYDAIRDQIFPLPGTVFRERAVPQTQDPNFARALFGRSGEVTAEIIEEHPGLFQNGDVVGISGLQARYNDILAGRPGVEISVLRAAPGSVTTTTGTGLTTTSAVRNPNEPETLATIGAEPGEPVITTIDPFMQQAAENALQRTDKTSALVAVEVSTGELVAVANGPRGAAVNFAMTGQYPPGSVFKIISAYAALRAGLGPNGSIDCPATVTVGGRTFANAGGEVFGTIPFHFAFAHSCNTAFVNATVGFPAESLTQHAALFGVGAEVEVGTDAFLGNVPVAESNVELAATSFGQGRVLMSPLAAAVMAATAADGTYRSPRLVTSPIPGPQLTVDLDPGPAADLRSFMREVVTSGTGGAVAGVAGGPVAGKTGTAEFGNASPPQSHAWFVGFQGNIAFAVFVEAGEFGGSTAAPIAAEFLNTLASRGQPPTEPEPEPEPEPEGDGT